MGRERDEGARAAWREVVAGLDGAGLIFFDETSAPLTLTPLRARAPRGERAVDRVSSRRWQSVTLLATLTATGMVPGLLIEGAADRRAIYDFVEQELVPSLRPGQIVVLHNISVHQSARARERLAAAGWGLRYLPTYSPDINPIEQAFARLQAHLRRAGARTYDGLLATVAVGVDAITAQDARAFFADTGYRIGEQLKRRT